MERLKALRKARQLTQSDVASYLGITVSAYGNYELGQREPDLATLNKLAEYFDVSVDYILGRTDERGTVGKNIYDISGISPRFLSLYNSLSPTQQDKVIAYMEGLLA